MHLEQFDESRYQKKWYGLFNELLIIYRGCVYPNGCHIHKIESDAALYTLYLCINSNIEFSKRN